MKLLILILGCMLATACSAQQYTNSPNSTTPNDSIMSYSNERFDFQYYDSLIKDDPNGNRFTTEDGTLIHLDAGYHGSTNEVRGYVYIYDPPPHMHLLQRYPTSTRMEL